MINRKELKKMYEEGMISKKEYALKLIELENMPHERKEKRIYEAVSEEDFIKLIKEGLKHTGDKLTQPAKLHFLCFILAYGSGLRISEVLALKPEDVNLKENKMFIRQAKGKKDRVVNTPKWLRQEHLKCLPIGEKMTARGIDKIFQEASIRAGINQVLYVDKAGRKRYRYHFHSLRSAFAVRSLNKGVPVHHLQLLLGHENLATTSRYTKSNPTDAIKSIMDHNV